MPWACGCYDLHGFSMGGFVAQEVALARPHQVRRLVLSGTGPQGGRHMHGWTGEILEACLRDEPGPGDLLTLFFERTETSRAKGTEYIQRIFTRTEDRDEPTDLATRDAQLTAIATWGIPDETRLTRLAGFPSPPWWPTATMTWWSPPRTPTCSASTSATPGSASIPTLAMASSSSTRPSSAPR